MAQALVIPLEDLASSVVQVVLEALLVVLVF